MMASAFHSALGEITLVLFTTLAPSGVCACIIICAVLVGKELDEALRQRINQFLCIPLVITMVGLIASATHLGNPSNALYVFMGVGRSPLSTEVFCAVLFLFLIGMYWLYSFARAPRVGIQKVWALLIGCTGVIFIISLAFAYDVRTIVSWNTFFTPLNIFLNALVNGPLVALLSLQVAKADFAGEQFGKRLCFLSAAALCVNTISYGLQSMSLPYIENSLGTAAELVPLYGIFTTLFFAFCFAALCLFWASLRKGTLPRLPFCFAACILAYSGIFLMRFAFYMMHMTVGVGMWL